MVAYERLADAQEKTDATWHAAKSFEAAGAMAKAREGPSPKGPKPQVPKP